MEEVSDLARYQDVLGQLPMNQVYSHILYIFPWSQDIIPRDALVAQLENAVTRVREAVPWIGARVVCEGRTQGNSGLYRVRHCAAPDPPIVVRDASDQALSFAELVACDAPVSMTDSDLFTSVSAFPEYFEDSDQDPAHTVRFQLTFIKHGVVFDFPIFHIMMDAAGQFNYLKMVAMAMRGEEFPTDMLTETNRDRRNLVPLLSADEPMLDHSHHHQEHDSSGSSSSPPPLLLDDGETRTYHIIRFSAANARELKHLASQAEGFHPEVPYITTDDAISGFCWQRLTKTRAHRFPLETSSRFARAVDGRKVMGISPDYSGNLLHNATTFMTFREICQSPLSTVASTLRKKLNDTNTAYHLRSFATFIDNEPDKSTITYLGKFNADTDVACSSICSHRGLFPSFGVLGKPAFVRRPPPKEASTLIVLFPANEEGDIDATICVTKAELDALNADPEWLALTRYIG